jgi:hypothetical protein
LVVFTIQLLQNFEVMSTETQEKKPEKIEIEEEIIYENLDNGEVLQKYKAASEVATGKSFHVLKSKLPF